MIFVDYTDCVPSIGTKVHGGAEYARRVLALLEQNGMKITILIPEEYKEHVDGDKILFAHKGIIVKPVKRISSFQVDEKGAILFIPLMSTRRLKTIVAIKENNPNLQVYLTIHGTRLVDLKPDIMDMYYGTQKKEMMYLLLHHLKYFAVRIMYKQIFAKYIPMFDGILTVSNDSLQKIQRLSSPKELVLFFEGSQTSDRIGLSKISVKQRENYFLFVSGGRPEKNLLRTLIAFQEFKKNDSNNMRLIVTGIREEIKDRFIKCKYIDSKCLESNVSLLPYVSDEELKKLYEKCKYLLYPSKSEGFGLPLVDSCYYGIPCITSSITATPEVQGSSAIYVDPYSVKSIVDGMHRAVSLNYDKWLERIEKTKSKIHSSIEAADSDFVQYIREKIEG